MLVLMRKPPARCCQRLLVVWRITREVLDADRAYLSDCLQHPAWRQMADVAEDHNTGDVIVTFRGEHPADSEATPALSTEQWRSD